MAEGWGALVATWWRSVDQLVKLQEEILPLRVLLCLLAFLRKAVTVLLLSFLSGFSALVQGVGGALEDAVFDASGASRCNTTFDTVYPDDRRQE